MTKIPKIYFFCCNEPDNYQDDIIPIAEGLQELGIPFYSNCNYWLQSTRPNDYLFKKNPDIKFQDCDIVVFPCNWFNWVRIGKATKRRGFPEGIFDKKRKYKLIAFDFSDGYQSPFWEASFREFDLILRIQYNKRCHWPSNFKPWGRGLLKRALNEISNVKDFENRSNEILVNYYASHSFEHSSRKWSQTNIDPLIGKYLKINTSKDDLSKEPQDVYERLMWIQTSRRHSSHYYKRLSNTKACSVFCGELIPSMPFNPSVYTKGGKQGELIKSLLNLLDKIKKGEPRLIQWSSFRFWETLASGACAINMDLEKAGVEIPVMPENFKHYVGINYYNPKQDIERLFDEPHKIREIAEEGSKWFYENYTPKHLAKRFLKTLGYKS